MTSQTQQVADHTWLSTILECPRKFYYRYERGLEGLSPYIPMLVGSAGHKGLQSLYSPESYWDVDAAVAATLRYLGGLSVLPPEGSLDYMTEGHVEIVMRNYADHYREREPYKLVQAIEEPIISEAEALGGIPDLIVEDGAGNKLVMDHKFTTGYLGGMLYSRVKHQHQLRIYAILTGCKAAVVNAIYMGKGASSPSSKAQRFDRYTFQYSESQLEETRDWVQQAKELVTYYRDENHPAAWTQNAGSQCGWCSYQDLCGSIPELRESIIVNRFRTAQRAGPLLSGAGEN